MKIEQLEQLVLIEKFGSISKAARETYMSPSALSNNLGDLEDEIGVCLFERSPMGVVPTLEGKEIIQHARTILNECEQILSYGKQSHSLSGEITVLLAPAYQYLYSKIILLFGKRFPEAVLHLKIFVPTQLFEMLSNGIANIGVVFATDKTCEKEYSNLDIERFSDNQLCFFFSKQHPLAAAETITAEDIAKECLFVYSEYHSEKAKLQPHVNQRITIVEDIESIMQLISAGEGIAYGLESAIKADWRYQQGLIVPLDIGTENGSAALVYPRKRKLTLLERKTLELLRDVLSNM